MGGIPQQVGPMPRSPQRAAGLPLMSTDTQVPNMIGPIGGRGIGTGTGIGFGPLGGWRLWACGAPMATDVSVAAGKHGSALAMALVARANPSLRRLVTRPGAPATAAMPPATLCSAFWGRVGGWAGGAAGKLTRGLLMAIPTPS